MAEKIGDAGVSKLSYWVENGMDGCHFCSWVVFALQL